MKIQGNHWLQKLDSSMRHVWEKIIHELWKSVMIYPANKDLEHFVKAFCPFCTLVPVVDVWSKRSKSAVAKSHYICIKSRSTASARLSANAHWLQTHWQRWLTDGWTGGWTDGQADGCYLVHCLPALRSIIMNSSGDITKQLYFQSVDWKGDRK